MEQLRSLKKYWFSTLLFIAYSFIATVMFIATQMI